MNKLDNNNIQDLPKADLGKIQVNDWIAGFGTISEYAIIGFLHRLDFLGYEIVKKEGE